MAHFRIVALSFLAIFSLQLLAQLPKEIPLYPEGIKNNIVVHPQKESYVDSLVKTASLSQKNRVYSFISEPTYMVFPAEESNNKKIGLVIFPGGGLVNNWLDKEGTDLALWLSEKGINCMVVKYRTNRRDEKRKFEIDYGDYKGAIYKDARESILKMKSMAAEYNFDSDKVGIMGFSAGAWLSSRMAVKYSDGKYEWKPAFVGLVYGGENVKSLKKVKDMSNFPPTFMVHGKNDHKLPLEKVLEYYTKILSEADKSELHIYAKGEHGFGLAYDNGHSVELWKESFYRWLLDIYNI